MVVVAHRKKVTQGTRSLSAAPRLKTLVEPKRSKRASSDYAVEVGTRIVQARKELGLTQEELAELAGVSQRSMQAYETGEVIPYRKMREIAAVVQRPAAWLLHGEAGLVESGPAEEIKALRDQVDELTKLIRSMSRKLS